MPLALILIGWASWTNPTHQSPTYLHSKVTHPKAQKPIKKKEKKKKKQLRKTNASLSLYYPKNTKIQRSKPFLGPPRNPRTSTVTHLGVFFPLYKLSSSSSPPPGSVTQLTNPINWVQRNRVKRSKPTKKNNMSDSEEHHFESKADAGASKTYPQQAGTIRKNGYIVIKNRPCKVQSFLLCFYDKIYFWFWVFFVFLA